LLIDGNLFSPYFGIAHKCVVHGDAIYASIAAASILAKTYRDDYMVALAEQYPDYGWKENKGYGTALHRKMILEKGLSPYHRKTFGICIEMAEKENKPLKPAKKSKA
jgi:ribonuclease HII